MRSADGVDVLVSFIKWSGLRLLMPAFEDLRERNVPVRLITTSYMGASDSPAVEWLAKMPNVQVRVSYDTERMNDGPARPASKPAHPLKTMHYSCCKALW